MTSGNWAKLDPPPPPTSSQSLPNAATAPPLLPERVTSISLPVPASAQEPLRVWLSLLGLAQSPSGETRQLARGSFLETLQPYALEMTAVYFVVLVLLGLRCPDSWFDVPVVMSGF